MSKFPPPPPPWRDKPKRASIQFSLEKRASRCLAAVEELGELIGPALIEVLAPDRKVFIRGDAGQLRRWLYDAYFLGRFLVDLEKTGAELDRKVLRDWERESGVRLSRNDVLPVVYPPVAIISANNAAEVLRQHNRNVRNIVKHGTVYSPLEA